MKNYKLFPLLILHRLVGGVGGVEGGTAGDVPGGHGAFLDGGHHGGARDWDDGSADDLGGVDEVAADVAQGPRAHGALVAPGHGGGGVDAVVAPVAAVEVVDLAQVALKMFFTAFFCVILQTDFQNRRIFSNIHRE